MQSFSGWPRLSLRASTRVIHASASVHGRDKKQLERLCRYLMRPPLAQARLHELPDGRFQLLLKKPWRDGTTSVVFEPLDFVARLVAAIPPPRFHLAVATDGTVSLVSDVVTSPGTGCQTGRRPQGLQPTSAHDAAHDSLGDFFAEVAYLEAASVDAFRVIAAELRHHGAPAELIAQAERAADEEVVHAELTARLSHRFGQLAFTPQVAPQPLRGLEAFARDNAVEGCVRETYGAALATYQAQAAADDEIRAALQLIARDETRHASLSWQIATWVTQKLDDAASARVRQGPSRRRAGTDRGAARRAVVTVAVDSQNAERG